MDPSGRALVLVALGAAAGGVARFVLAGWFPRDFPWGTAAVNVLGSFAIGALLFGGLAGGWLGPDARLLVGVGFLGAFTTMSTFAYETLALAEAGAWTAVLANVALNPVLSLVAAWAGRAVGLAVPGGGA